MTLHERKYHFGMYVVQGFHLQEGVVFILTFHAVVLMCISIIIPFIQDDWQSNRAGTMSITCSDSQIKREIAQKERENIENCSHE